jgi:hypothetical protein
VCTSNEDIGILLLHYDANPLSKANNGVTPKDIALQLKLQQLLEMMDGKLPPSFFLFLFFLGRLRRYSQKSIVTNKQTKQKQNKQRSPSSKTRMRKRGGSSRKRVPPSCPKK